MMLACNVMATRIAGIHPKASLEQAIALMADFGITTLPVVDVSGTLVGMLSGGDILRRTKIDGAQDADETASYRATVDSLFGDDDDGFDGGDDRAAAYWHTEPLRVEEVMTPDVCTVEENTPLAEVASLVKARAIKRLPVVHGDKIVGIINRAELMHALREDFDDELSAATPDDSAIKDAVRAVLHRLKWAPGPLIDISVEAGKVELNGTLLKEGERKALRKAVANIPGVAGFADHLVLAEPFGGMFAHSLDDLVRRQKLY
jgi:CBS domain-containing protein